MGVWLCVLVCAHEVEGIEQNGLHATFLKIVHNHVGADNLALCHDALFLEACEEILGERAQELELRLQELACLLLVFVGREQFLYMLHVFLLQVVDNLVSALRVLLVQIVADFNEGVGSTAHGGEHNESLLTRFGDEL